MSHYCIQGSDLTLEKGESIPDRVPKKFFFEKERKVSMGRIQAVDVRIYSCEMRDTGGIVDPKYSDDPGRKPNYQPRHQLTMIQRSRCQGMCQLQGGYR